MFRTQASARIGSDDDDDRELSPDRVRERIDAVPHWHHRIEIAPGIVTPGVQDCVGLLGLLGLPDDCVGLRALDVGTRDGYFAFELERRGAEVVAIDNVPAESTGFGLARELLGSTVQFRTQNVYDLSPDELGRFDLVLFAGVLYHLRHPLLALDRIWDVCRPGAQLFVESHVIDDGLVDERGELGPLAAHGSGLAELSLLQFFPGRTLAADPTNQFGPNMTCLQDLIASAGFDVERTWQHGTRGGLTAQARLHAPDGERAIDSASRWDPYSGRGIDRSVLSPAPTG